MIDPSIITRGAERAQMQQQQNFESLGELGNSLGRLVLGRRINTLQQLGTPEEKQAYANKSIYAPQLNAQIKADQAAEIQAQMVQQKHASDISKTNSEAFKNNQQGSGFGLDNGQKQLGAINSAIQQASMTGDKTAAIIGLDAARRVGLVSSDDYNQHYKVLSAMTPEEVKSYAQSVTFANAKDPASIAFQTANNVADNAQSDTNSKRTYEASVYGTNKSFELGQDRIKQDDKQFNKNYEYTAQQDEIKNKQGEIKEFGGNAYIVYKNGDYRPLVDENGQPVKSQAQKPMSATTQKELFEVDDSIAAGSNAITNLRDALKYSANAYDGVGAIQRAKAMGHVSNNESARNTVLLDNIVSGNALEMLKATFGGAPTEGERKILLELQGSANLPSDQREAIYTRAIAAAERRLATNEKKAQGLRDGSYFKPSQLQQGQVPSSGASGKRPPVASFFQ